ncbi:MAG: hypothetical protein JWL81_1447, partial [Verrucomicrobiales bacterium]|nr:hypothetical protein [Verrucomicrobiales bacterium]
MLWAGLLMLGGAVWLGVYAWDQGFTKKWRGLIAKELAKHGLRADIGRLTLDPVEGLTARDVKLFDMTHRDQHLADIDRISLDVDVARLVNQEDFLRTIHLQKADVSLPVDPGDPKSEWLTVKDLNARLVFQQDRIEIAKAEGEVSGIAVKVSGSVRKPRSVTATRDEKERVKEERTRQLREMRDRRGALRSVLRMLDRFEIPRVDGVPARAHKAELSLEVQGDLSDIDRMEVRAMLTGGALRHRGGMVESFDASMRLADGLLTLHRLSVKDAQGALNAAATWKIREAPGVDFSVDCSLDLQTLLRTALDEAAWLGEVVCYTPPSVVWNGRWLTGETNGGWPVEGQGRVRMGRFSTKGMVFDGLEAKLALKPERVIYVREGVLTHHSGEVRGQVLMGGAGGRYELDWRMAVGAAAPFLPEGGMRNLLERFDFDPASRIAVKLQGDGTGEAGSWRHSGRFQLRDFSYQGTPLKEVAAGVTWNPAAAVPLVFRDAVLEMSEGIGKAREVRLDTRQGLLTLVGGEGTLMPAPLMHLFLPPLGRELEKYRFEKSPEARMDGVIDLRGLERSDYRIVMRSRSRCGLDVAGNPMEFDQAAGNVHILGPFLSLELTGATAPGTSAFHLLRFEEAAPAAFSGRFPLGPKAGIKPEWKVDIRAPGRVSLDVLGRRWPLEQFAGSMQDKEGGLSGTGGAQLLDGKFGASLEFPDSRSPAHHGSVVVENVSFARLAAIVDPSHKTEGRLTGSFSYHIPGASAEALTGKGEATLEEANIFALPLLGPLSSLIDALIPGEDLLYSVARKATATLSVADGKVSVPDFKAETAAFRLTAAGEVDYLKDRVDFLARVNLRGAPGMLLYPVSKLFEYAADGTMADPSWHPRFFGGPFRPKAGSDEKNNKESSGTEEVKRAVEIEQDGGATTETGKPKPTNKEKEKEKDQDKDKDGAKDKDGGKDKPADKSREETKSEVPASIRDAE